MNILLTGGAGYIGSHTCLSLLDAGHKVTIIDDLSTGHEQLIPSKAKFVKTNINDINIINKLLKSHSYDALIHFAGFTSVEESVHFPKKYFINNTRNSEILFKTCLVNGLKNIVFSSSATVYGNANKGLIKENANIRPLNPYGESKVRTENTLIQMQKNNQINYVILRYFNVAGADLKLRSGPIAKNSTHLIKVACEAVVGKRNSVTIFGSDYDTKDGTAIRDYIHVTDLAEIHIKSLEYILENKRSTILNCGYGKGYSVKEVLDALNKICHGSLKFKYGKKRLGDSITSISDVTNLIKTIKWQPKYNNIELILKTAVKWEEKLMNEKIF